MDAYTKLLRIAQVSEKTTLSKSTLWLKIAQGQFPRPIKLTPGINVWKDSEVNAWIESHEENRSAREVKNG